MSARASASSPNSRLPGEDWRDLFAGADDLPTSAVPMRVLRKHGQPFLVLPTHPRLAAHALDLYPAQTPKARLAKAVLRLALKTGIPLPLSRASLRVSVGDAFASFLRGLVGAGTGAIPPVAILAGNPRTPGRRFLLVVFGADHKPAVVVKAGLSQAARELIAREESFLKSVGPGMPGVPALHDSFQSDRLQAFGLDFVAGRSPTAADETEIVRLLKAWPRADPLIPVVNLPAWQRLASACPAHPRLAQLTRRLEGCLVQPVLVHGDFAPWNLKLPPTGGPCVALDWERGERAGIPGWDWFHFVLQSAILAEKLPVHRVQRRAERLLASPPFQRYAAQCRMTGFERDLFLACLLYSIEVLKPSEGLAVTQALLDTLSRAWHDG